MNADRLLAHYEKISDTPDAIPSLRRFILDLAVRGKLVEQDPKDGNGSSLLVKVERAWAGRISSGKVKKQKVWESPGFSDVPFEVPNNWALVRLGQAVELVNGRAFKPSDWTPTGLPIVRIQNLNNPTASFNRYDGEVKDKFLIDTGDFLISWSGTPGTSFGAHVWERGPAVLNQHIFKSIIIGDAFEIPFLKLAINSRLLELIEQAHGGVGLQHITKPKLEAVVLTLPPRAEQHRIVAKVDELMALCDQLEAARTEREATRDRLAAASLARLNAPDPDPAVFQNHAGFALDSLSPLTTRPDQIKALRQTILNLAVRGKLVPQDPNDEPASELSKRIAAEKSRLTDVLSSRRRRSDGRERTEAFEFTLPRGWTLSTLGSVALKITDGAHQTPTYVGSGVPFVSVKDFSAGRLDLSNTRFITENEHSLLCKRCDPKRGDILIGRIGTLGRAVLVDTDDEFSLFVSVGLIRFSHENIAPRFLRTLLNSPLVEGEFDRIKIGGGTHTNKLNLGDLQTVALPIPPLAEQHRIVAKVDELMALCNQLKASLAIGDDTRCRLLDAMLHETLEPVKV